MIKEVERLSEKMYNTRYYPMTLVEHLLETQSMEPYLILGVVRPERAQISLQFSITFSHFASGFEGEATVSILRNQVAVWVKSEHEWDVDDLRNLVKNIVQDHLAIVGYLKGYAYDLELTRVLNQSRGIDNVFGIDIPCLAKRGESIDLRAAFPELSKRMEGPNGVYLNRCLTDLSLAMKHGDDTGFYCYRAIESLRLHCAVLNGLIDAPKLTQWEKFREVSGADEETLCFIKLAADQPRHGNISVVKDEDRVNLFTKTWDIVDRYLNSVQSILL
jgi:hypothetical protein